MLLYNNRWICLLPFARKPDPRRVSKQMVRGLIIMIYCETAMMVADIFTKQLFPKHFERLRMVLLGHENWDDMVQRVESVTTAGDDIDDPKLYTSGNSAPRGQGGHPK